MPTFRAAQRKEMPAIKGEHIKDSVAFGQNDVIRGIGEADGELPIASDDHSG